MPAPAPTAGERLADLVADQRTTFRAIADRAENHRRVLDASVGLDYRTRTAFDDIAELLRKAATGELLPDPDPMDYTEERPCQ